MVIGVYTVYDRKAEAYDQPIFARTDAEVVRSLQDAISKGNNLFSNHPQDFCVYCIGFFYAQDGVIVPVDPIKLIIDCVSLADKFVGDVNDVK